MAIKTRTLIEDTPAVSKVDTDFEKLLLDVPFVSLMVVFIERAKKFLTHGIG